LFPFATKETSKNAEFFLMDRTQGFTSAIFMFPDKEMFDEAWFDDNLDWMTSLPDFTPDALNTASRM
jgi:hypothetical protein